MPTCARSRTIRAERPGSGSRTPDTGASGTRTGARVGYHCARCPPARDPELFALSDLGQGLALRTLEPLELAQVRELGKSDGDMVACDNKNCPYEWFHYGCVGITAPPKGKWFCPHCVKNMRRSQSSDCQR
ncbi:PHD-finger domain-containing protein [Ditylenchus destructor]|uniref:PHD-finger domain-containing protein n=1 Tax=Ditylenchus destructor TaxID=166010 RepID=A0AAD4N067_9BILA|nr:PHD-finger domain-containing protein [Ditylenchus destructor]